MTEPDRPAEYVVALKWVIERLDLMPDDEEGVWLSMGLGKILRPPPEVNSVFMELHNDGSERT